MKIWDSVSASQIAAFRRCPRLWYNQSILGIKPLPTAAQVRGTAIHAEMEHYLKTGEVRVGEWAPRVEILREMLPTPGSGLLVEHEFHLPTFAGGPELIGYIDCASVSSVKRRVIDLKTTSDFRYVKTPDELAVDVQMIVYAAWMLSDDAWRFEDCSIAHVYTRTRGKAAGHIVQTTVTRDHVAAQWAKILDTIREMQAWANKAPPTADDLPPRVEACGDFGGCAFRARCGFLDQKEGSTMGLAEMLAKSKTNGAAPAPKPQVAVGVLPPDAPARTDAPKKKNVSVKIGNAEVLVVPETAVATDLVAPAPAPAPEKIKPVIYVDCYPTKHDHFCLEDAAAWLLPIMASAAEVFKVPDYRLIDYGKSKGALACAIRASVEMNPLPEALFVDSRSPGSDVLLEQLTPYASAIVRGLR